ncbi:citrate (Si)-synthase [Bowdeniella nasicola]|uniref:Citrate synthase n=1 Tax=Bowdeniella nasicola TaxID=208480 RepID=A0A1Q5Q2F0_9ACTO|nr:citrate synthase [Bowdeniella nasicola]OKL54028.1 citrate (Si)-synthase [Bowdeniella nasicola]
MTESELTPATFSVDDKTLEFPRVKATEGNDGVAINTLLKDTGLVTLDTGFVNTASCESKITYIDGGEGILRYRGYPIEELANNSRFLEVAYLLIYGDLPDMETYAAVVRRIKRHRLLHEDFKAFFTAFPSNGHPMAILQAGISGLATYYQHTLDPKDKYQIELATVLLMAKVPTMISYISRRAQGLPLMYPDSSLQYIEDFIRMTFGMPYANHDVDPILTDALNKLLILHADHEQNCSTSTVRMVGSSEANIYASVAAGVGALSGPLHGGANEAVLRMLTEIQESDMSVQDFVTKVKNKEDGVRLMGFGHRVYKSYDPRASIAKQSAHDVLEKLGKSNEQLDIAMELEEIALQDDYFIERNLYPNVDFYTGLIYKAMGFPEEMFTPLFALGRLPGWIAQYREMIEDPATKIGRPRQVYTGATERHWIPRSER